MHHAQLILGSYSEALAYLEPEHTVSGPDTSVVVVDTFGIDDARNLKREAMQMPVLEKQRVFVLSVASITVQAQNALLKLFEEPPKTARFYLHVLHEDVLIPTLLSRLHRVDIHARLEEITPETKQFLKSTYSERLFEIAERAKAKDTLWIEALLQGLEHWVTKYPNKEVLNDLIFVRMYHRSKSASVKMLLEHLALSLPIER
jgi:hypothetical protein